MEMNANISKQKELFVSNTLGTSPTEIVVVASTPILSCLVYALIKTQNNLTRNGKIFHDTVLFFVEFFMLVLIPLTTVTVLSDHVFPVNILLVLIAIKIVYQHSNEMVSSFQNVVSTEHLYLTNYKAQIQICTAICILAVDFGIFPRRFAKAEVYGVGVMDMAVGSIIFSNALTSSLSRMNTQIRFQHVLRHFQTSFWLVCLGVLRIILVKGSSYQEHVTEYGVHWNFFFTLALVKPVCMFVLFLFPWLQKQPFYLFISAVLIICYQLLLTKYDFMFVIQNGFRGDKSRTTFLDANREGIFSCIGYSSIFFAGLFVGKQLFKEDIKYHDKVIWLMLWSLCCWTGMHVNIIYVAPISRQMCNLSYYLLQVSCNCFLLLGYMIIDIVCASCHHEKQKKTERKYGTLYLSLSILCRAINRNLLAYFLLANIGTGFVNFFLNTLTCTPIVSVVVIASYLFVVNSLVWIVFTFQV